MNDFYATLGVGRDASREQIDEAFARAAGDTWDEQRLRELQVAYGTLADPDRRAQYDRWVERESEPRLPAYGEPAARDGAQRREHHSRNPVDRLTRGLPHGWRVTIDWVVTIAGAIAIVLAIKAWVVNPYRIPSSSMEPTLHCAAPADGCEASFSDRVLANRFIYHFTEPERGDIVVFETPLAAQQQCGAGGTFVKRLIGLPGERVELRPEGGVNYVYIDGKRLEEPYIARDRRD